MEPLPMLDINAILSRLSSYRWLWAKQLLVHDLGVYRFKGGWWQRRCLAGGGARECGVGVRGGGRGERKKC